MTRRSIGILVLPALVLALAGLTGSAATDQDKGRYKKQGDDCVWWDPNDVGDDQCRPPKGRWKLGGDKSCAWDPKDGGPDQCSPRRAR
jgi:hypothetical protein